MNNDQCCEGTSVAQDVGDGFTEVPIKLTTTPAPTFTEHHPAVSINTPTTIPERAAELLETAAKTIRERGLKYNNNEVHYEDYRLNGMMSTWEDILECFVRLYVSGDDDKAVDWVAYTALQAAFVEAGMPQSQFSPIFKKIIKGLG